jgi:hypothetical protein
MNEFHFIQSPLFSVFVSNGKTCFVSDGATAPVLFENRSSEIAHELWKSAALPRHQGDLVAGIVGLYSEMEISQALAKMLQEGIIVAGSEQDIAALLRPPSRSLPCERLLVCMSGAIQIANFSHFLIALRLGFCQELKIILTAAARKFVRGRALGLLLEAEVHIDAFETTASAFGVPHIALSEWASCVLIAPATASVIHRIAHATCDDLLSLTIAATRSEIPVVIGPSMNVGMWHNRTVQQNVQRCREHGFWVIEPGKGVEAFTPWNSRVPQQGVFGATPSRLVKGMATIYEASTLGAVSAASESVRKHQ